MPAGTAVLRESLAQQRTLLTASSLLAAVHQGGEALVPVLLGVLIDEAVATGSGTRLLLWMLVLAADFLVLSTAYRYSARCAERGNQQAAHRLRVRVTERVLDARGGAEARRLPGELVNIATEDARRVGLLQFAIPYGLCAAMAGVLVSAISLLRISVPLGLTVLLGAPLIVFGAQWIGKPLQRRSEAEQERAAFASGVAADLVTGLRVLKGIGAQRAATDRYRTGSRASLAATLRAARAQAWHDAAILMLTGLFIAAVALVGALLAAGGGIGIGGLVSAIGLAQYLLGPFQSFGTLNGTLAKARASAGRLEAVLESPAAVEGGTAAPREPVYGRLRVHGVRAGPLSGMDMDLDVEPGELLGVVCPDPEAARTLAELLGRQRDPDRGRVLLDGRDLAEQHPAALRRAVLVAGHDAELFAGSLAENVAPDGPSGGTYDGTPDSEPDNEPDSAPDSDPDNEPDSDPDNEPDSDPAGTALQPAMRAAAADEVAASLPGGVSGRVAERGASLSGGQRQRVALARALAAEAPVLVLHDPTTAVDVVTETRIAASLREFRAGRTTVLLATSPALLAVTDRVVFLAGGEVAASGTHAGLAEANPAYRAAVLS